MKKSAFSIIEISIVIIVVAIIAVFAIDYSAILKDTKLSNAKNLTQKSPISQINNIAFWYETSLDESFESDIKNNDIINSWYQSKLFSGNRIQLIQNDNNDLLKPQYLEKGINELPSLLFNNSGNCLRNKGNNNVYFNGKNYSLYIIFKPYDTSSNHTLIHLEKTGIGSAIYLSLDLNNINFSHRQIVSSSGGNNFTISNISNNKIYIIKIVKRQNKLSMWLNNSKKIDQQAIASSNFNVNDFNIHFGSHVCRNATLSRKFSGLISEIIIFNQALNSEDLQLIDQYLSKKYLINL
jgi:hypothetical protein|tara:strand:- start:7884 stop:8768 length:885 start_codon:yes stop_codon:yes gene_type:complete